MSSNSLCSARYHFISSRPHTTQSLNGHEVPDFLKILWAKYKYGILSLKGRGQRTPFESHLSPSTVCPGSQSQIQDVKCVPLGSPFEPLGTIYSTEFHTERRKGELLHHVPTHLRRLEQKAGNTKHVDGEAGGPWVSASSLMVQCYLKTSSQYRKEWGSMPMNERAVWKECWECTTLHRKELRKTPSIS